MFVRSNDHNTNTTKEKEVLTVCFFCSCRCEQLAGSNQSKSLKNEYLATKTHATNRNQAEKGCTKGAVFVI